MATSSTTIPSELGVGGAYLSPGGATGEPWLSDLLSELQGAANAGSRVAPPQWQKVAADGAANTATAETFFYRAPVAMLLLAAHLVFDAAVTADDTNNAVVTIRRRDSAGANAAVVKAFTTNIAGGDFVAFAPKALGSLSNTSIPAGSVLTVEISKDGSGVQLPIGRLVLDAEPVL